MLLTIRNQETVVRIITNCGQDNNQLGYRLDDPGFEFRQRLEICLFSEASRLFATYPAS